MGVINTLTGQDSFVGANTNCLISSPWDCTRWCNEGTNVTHLVVLCCWMFVPQMSLISADGQDLKCSWLTTCASVYNTLCEWVSQPHPGCCVYHYMVRMELFGCNQVLMAITAWYHCHTNQISTQVCEYSTPVAGLCEGARDISAAMWSSTWILWQPCGLAHLNIIVSLNSWNSM